MSSKRLIAVLLFCLGAADAAQAKINYGELCADFLEAADHSPRPILPDSRSEQQIVLALDQVTREFRELHPDYAVTSAFAKAEGSAPVVLQREGALEIVDHIFQHVRLANQIDQGTYFTPEVANFVPNKGWIVEQTLWKKTKVNGVANYNFKNVRFSAALAPSPEFQALKGLRAASSSIFKQELDVLRYHPSVVVFVPAAILAPNLVSLRNEFPEFNEAVEAKDQKLAQEQRESFNQFGMPVYRDIFTQRALMNLLMKLKAEVDAVVGAETKWSLSARTGGEFPLPELTELMIKIDHPVVETAWRASLEFTNRYALAVSKKVSNLETPAPDAVPTNILPVAAGKALEINRK
jgi:hypothetical protein